MSPSAAGMNGGSASRPLNCPDLPDSHIPGITGPRRRGFVCFYCRLVRQLCFPPPTSFNEILGCNLISCVSQFEDRGLARVGDIPYLLDSGISEAGGVCVRARAFIGLIWHECGPLPHEIMVASHLILTWVRFKGSVLLFFALCQRYVTFFVLDLTSRRRRRSSLSPEQI